MKQLEARELRDVGLWKMLEIFQKEIFKNNTDTSVTPFSNREAPQIERKAFLRDTGGEAKKVGKAFSGEHLALCGAGSVAGDAPRTLTLETLDRAQWLATCAHVHAHIHTHTHTQVFKREEDCI